MKNLLDHLALKEEDVRFSLYGRNALYALLKSLKKTGRSSIAYPAYSCGDEIAPAVDLQCTLYFYDITSDLSPSEDTANYFDQIDILVVTHFFGIVTEATLRLIQHAQQRNIVVIEDCAYALCNPKAGKSGDYAVYSLRKHLPIPHGGLVIRRHPKLPLPPHASAPPQDAITIEFDNFAAYQSGSLTVGSGKHLSIDGDPFGARLNRFGGYDLGISKQALDLIAKTDIADTITQKDHRFDSILNFFEKRLDQEVLQVAMQIQPKTGPAYFPLIVRDSTQAYQNLAQQGVAVVPFWNRYHPFIEWSRYPHATTIKQKVISLPLQTNYNESQINLVAQEVLHNYG